MAEHQLIDIRVPDNDLDQQPIGPDFLVLKFADSKIPVFKETKRDDYIKYGEDNAYPEYLNYLFNKSGKHNAILVSKAKYIFGKGYVNGDMVINRLGESLNDISDKAILDIEVYGGFRWEVVWNALGKIAEIYHVDFSTVRTAKVGGYYYKENWERKNDREDGQLIDEFNPKNPIGTQIFAYDEYRPGLRYYPLPSYIGCINYIEVDIEIGKFNLSTIRNGLNPSKMIQFFKGEPTEDKKREIERRMSNKFAGSENAGKFLLVFNDSNTSKSVQVDDLSASDLDKMYDVLNKTCQQEILAGHQITSPTLFGIQEPGKLGGNTELYTAYAIFKNTYATPKAEAFSKEVEYLMSYSNFPGEYELEPIDPIGAQIDIHDIVNSLPKAWVFDLFGIPEEMWGLENIGADNRPTPTVPIAPSTTVADPTVTMANDNIKNLTAKQHQQVMRILRQHDKGQLSPERAKALLRMGYGLSDEDINIMLGTKPLAASFEAEDDIIGMFDACGESKSDFEILRSKRVSFSSELEAESDEEIFIHEAFKTYDVTATENTILELIKKDKRITPEVIASVTGQSKAFIESKIDSLTKRGYLESTTTTVGIDEIIERTVNPIDIVTPPPTGKINPTQIYIKYSYEGPQDSRNRPFCAKMMELHRLYSRAEIEQISQRLGYSVFDRRGGFWTRKGTNDTTPYCRHNWKSNIVVKK